MWYVREVLYAVLYVRVSCFVVRERPASRRYIHICNMDVSSVVNMYHDHLKFCVACINVCGECYVVSNECDEHTPSCATCRFARRSYVLSEFFFWGGGLVSKFFNDIIYIAYMCVVNKQFELLEFDLIPLMLT